MLYRDLLKLTKSQAFLIVFFETSLYKHFKKREIYILLDLLEEIKKDQKLDFIELFKMMDEYILSLEKNSKP